MQAQKQSLLGVQPVLGLLEHDRTRAIHDFVADLPAPVRRQAVHHHGLRGQLEENRKQKAKAMARMEKVKAD